MAIKNQNVEMWANDRKTFVFTCKDANGAAVDITAASAIAFGFSAVKDGPALVTKTLGSGVTIVSGPAGTFSVTLEPADTNARSGRFFLATKVTLAGSGEVVAEGELLVNVHCLD